MYKVFINDSSIKFTNNADLNDIETLNYSESMNFESLMQDIENSNSLKNKMLFASDPEIAWKSFAKNFKIIEAAGGIVRRENGDILFIYRLGKWDLPKGKLEKNEGIQEAALREVEEECGIDELKISNILPDTWHTYTLKGQRILKRTYWFEMETTTKNALVPQIEEDITEVKWVKNNEIAICLNNTYASIASLLSDYIKP